MSLNRVILLCFFSFMLHPILRAEDGYRLWMRYEVIPAGALRDSYIEYLGKIDYENEEISPQLSVAISELDRGVSGLMGGWIRFECSSYPDRNAGKESGN